MKKFALIMLGLSLFITGCGGEKKEEKINNNIVVSQGSKPKSLDPNMYNDIPALTITEQIFNTLLKVDENGNIVPELAESFEYVSPTELVIKIRQGVKFHNGDTLTSKDVAFSINRMLDKPASRVMIDAITKVEIIDDYTVKIITSEPFGALLNHLTHPTAAIMSEKAVKAAGDSYGQHPVGTGPYKFVSWQSGDKITLEANPDYFLGVTPIKNVVFRPVTEASNRTIGIETVELDLAYDIEGLDREKLRNDDSIVFLEEPSFGIDYIGFNTRKAPFDNVKVRQAIATAINADDFITAVYKGSGEKANSLIGPKVFGYTTEAKAWEYNVEKAKQLLAEAGYPNGFKAKIWINENVERRDIAIILQAQLKEIGIDLAVETLEWGAYLDGTARGDHELFMLGWVTVTGDADYGLYPLLHSSSFGGAGNRAFYHNPKVDELLSKARVSINQEERKELYKEVQIIAQEEVPYYVTAYKSQNAALQKNIENFKLKPAGHHRLYGVKFKTN